jgi:TubC N-terminal docking domain
LTPSEVIRLARAKGIQLVPDANILKVRAPAGAVDPELRESLTRYKPAILQLLAGPSTNERGGPMEHCLVCGCPSWWQPKDSPRWVCSHCERWSDLSLVAHIHIMPGGQWAKH